MTLNKFGLLIPKFINDMHGSASKSSTYFPTTEIIFKIPSYGILLDYMHDKSILGQVWDYLCRSYAEIYPNYA